MRKANLRGAELGNADLWGVDLREATLGDADPRVVELQDTEWRDRPPPGTTRVLFTFHEFDEDAACRQLRRATNWKEAYRDETLACGEMIPTGKSPFQKMALTLS